MAIQAYASLESIEDIFKIILTRMMSTSDCSQQNVLETSQQIFWRMHTEKKNTPFRLVCKTEPMLYKEGKENKGKKTSKEEGKKKKFYFFLKRNMKRKIFLEVGPKKKKEFFLLGSNINNISINLKQKFWKLIAISISQLPPILTILL